MPYLVCLDCTRSRTNRAAGGWKTGECSLSLSTSLGQATLKYISYVVPDVHDILSIAKHRRQTPLYVNYDQTRLGVRGLLLEESIDSVQGHILKNTFRSLARCLFLLSDSFNMYDTT